MTAVGGLVNWPDAKRARMESYAGPWQI